MSRCVLVVDDSKLARMSLTAALHRLHPDWRVAEAAHADAGREALRGDGVDIALIDYNMPQVDGLTLAAEIRSSHPDLPIALITANIQDSIVERARTIDVTFIPKPVADDALAAFLAGAALRLRRTGAGHG